MARWAPSVTAVYPRTDGAVDIHWDLDRFFGDPEEPDEIRITTPHDSTPPLPGSQRNYTLPKDVVALYAGGQLVGQVVFTWRGSPNEVLASAFAIGVPGKASGSSGTTDYRPGMPVLTLVSRAAKTLRQENTITIRWSSSNLTRGRIVWGPSENPRANIHTFKQSGDNYVGQFTTDRPLIARTSYQFLVRVENTYHATSTESVIVVTSHDNHRSLKGFLAASGVSTPAGLRAYVAGGSNLRGVLGV